MMSTRGDMQQGMVHLDMVQYLVEEHGADVHADDKYAWRYATKNRHWNVVDLLTWSGINKCSMEEQCTFETIVPGLVYRYKSRCHL